MKIALALLVGVAIGVGAAWLVLRDDQSGPSITAARAEQMVRDATDADKVTCRKSGDEFSCTEFYIQYGGNGELAPRGQSRVFEQGNEYVVESAAE